jgi:hypothetical protein
MDMTVSLPSSENNFYILTIYVDASDTWWTRTYAP